MLRTDFATIELLAEALGISTARLNYLAFGLGRRYSSVKIKKRRGGFRQIDQPTDKLKRVQNRLGRILEKHYGPRRCVTGFTHGQSIARNAQVHAAHRWVLNVDLKDFFPSIHFGRIRGMLIAPPYRVPAKVATVVAQLCCTREGFIPQGSPTSPVLSNMVCAKLDSELSRLCRRYRITYTRYVDDLTFSSDHPEFPGAFASRDAGGFVELGDKLSELIEGNGFEANPEKVRLAHGTERQEVTGLTVNEFPNVRRKLLLRIRAMLHAWEKHGHELAEREFLARYDTKHRSPHSEVNFGAVVKGYIDFVGMVRGIDDRHYRRFLEWYSRLMGSEPRPLDYSRPNHINTYRDGVWVVEAGISQGTAFEVGPEGLALSCSHVVQDSFGRPHGPLSAFRPKRSDYRVQVQVVRSDLTQDLVLLRLGASSGYVFNISPGEVRHAQTLLVSGFPEYHLGGSLWEQHGQVTSMSRQIDQPRFLVSQHIVRGASGAPVMDVKHRVVGVASMGAAAREATDATVRYGVIPGRIVAAFLNAQGT